MPSLELRLSHQLYRTSLAGSCLQRCHSRTQSSTSNPFPKQLLSCRRDTTAVGMASVQSQRSMSHESFPVPSGWLEDAGLTFLLYPFPFMKDESNNLWQFPPLPTPSQILPSVGHKHIFNELGLLQSHGSPSPWLGSGGPCMPREWSDPGMSGCRFPGHREGVYRILVKRLSTDTDSFVDRVLLKTFQKRKVSSPAPVTMASPSGDIARYRTR